MYPYGAFQNTNKLNFWVVCKFRHYIFVISFTKRYMYHVFSWCKILWVLFSHQFLTLIVLTNHREKKTYHCSLIKKSFEHYYKTLIGNIVTLNYRDAAITASLEYVWTYIWILMKYLDNNNYTWITKLKSHFIFLMQIDWRWEIMDCYSFFSFFLSGGNKKVIITC